MSGGDTRGLRHLEVALSDIPYPTTTSALRSRVGGWLVPYDGTRSVTVEHLLEGVPDRTFSDAHDVVRAVHKARPGFPKK